MPGTTEGVKEYDAKHVAIENVECVRHTEKAALMIIFGEEHWVPQAHIGMDSEVYQRGHIGKLVMTKWIAIKRELWEED